MTTRNNSRRNGSNAVVLSSSYQHSQQQQQQQQPSQTVPILHSEHHAYPFQADEWEGRIRRLWLTRALVISFLIVIGFSVLPAVLKDPPPNQRHNRHGNVVVQVNDTTRKTTGREVESKQDDETKNNLDNNSNNDRKAIDPQSQQDLLNQHTIIIQQNTTTTETITKAKTTTSASDADSTTTSSLLSPGCEATVLIIRHCEKHGPLATTLDDMIDNNNVDPPTNQRPQQHCSYLGWERSYFLTTLFEHGDGQQQKQQQQQQQHTEDSYVKDSSGDTAAAESSTPRTTTRRWPTPSLLYALSPKRKNDDKNQQPAGEKKESSPSSSAYYYNFREWETLLPLSTHLGLPVHVQYNNGYDLANDVFGQLQRGSLCGKLVLVAWKHSLFVELATALGCGPNDGCPTFYPEESYDQVWQIKYVYNVVEHIVNEREQKIIADNVRSDNNNNATQRQLQNIMEQHQRRFLRKKSQEQQQQQQEWRRLKKSHHHHSDHSNDGKRLADSIRENEINDDDDNIRNDRTNKGKWSIYGSTSYQNFDPLQYSYQVGDYPSGGTPTGGLWAAPITTTQSWPRHSESATSSSKSLEHYKDDEM